MSIPATAESWRLQRFRNRRRLERLQRCRAVAVDWHDQTGVALVDTCTRSSHQNDDQANEVDLVTHICPS